MTNVELSIHCSIVKIDFSPNRFVNLGRIKSVIYVYGDLRKILLLILLLGKFLYLWAYGTLQDASPGVSNIGVNQIGFCSVTCGSASL
jgi:hypothetical protein